MTPENGQYADPPMEPMAGSTWWLSSDVTAIASDPDLATLIIRLELALNALLVHMRAGERLAADLKTAEGTRDFFLSCVTTASYTKEALNILMSVSDVPPEATRVAELAERGGVTAPIAKAIGKLCAGTHPASQVLKRIRNELGFHWDPGTLQPSLLEFVPNRRVIWAEAKMTTQRHLVHRLAIDVLGNALLPPDDQAPTDPAEKQKQWEQRLQWAMRDIAAAANTIIEYFEYALSAYFESIGAIVERSEPESLGGE